MIDRTIWKYELQTTPRQFLDLPRYAEPRHVALQGGKPMLWAEVLPDQPMERREVALVATGGEAPGWVYVGTLHVPRNAPESEYVFHVFIERVGVPVTG